MGRHVCSLVLGCWGEQLGLVGPWGWAHGAQLRAPQPSRPGQSWGSVHVMDGAYVLLNSYAKAQIPSVMVWGVGLWGPTSDGVMPSKEEHRAGNHSQEEGASSALSSGCGRGEVSVSL